MTIDSILRHKGRGVITIEPDTVVGAALCLMRHKKVGAVVVSITGRDVFGLVCERDLVRALKSHGVTRLMSMTVGEIMRRGVASCRPEEELRRVMTRMIAKRLQHIPVINENGICGIVSLGEIVKWRLAQAKEDAALMRRTVRLPA